MFLRKTSGAEDTMWRSKLMSILRQFTYMRWDPEDMHLAIRDISCLRVRCELKLGRNTYDPPKPDLFEWTMAECLKKGGIEVVGSARPLPLLKCNIEVPHCAEKHVTLFGIHTRLLRPHAVADRPELLLWRSFRVAGISTRKRLWYDICAALYGQVEQFVQDHKSVQDKHP